VESIEELLSYEEELLPLFENEGQGHNVRAEGNRLISTRALGVVCIRISNEARLSKLEESGRVVALLEQDKNGDLRPNPDGVYGLVNFLAGVRLRGHMLTGRAIVNWKNLKANRAVQEDH
jgi:hypothetical protein